MRFLLKLGGGLCLDLGNIFVGALLRSLIILVEIAKEQLFAACYHQEPRQEHNKPACKEDKAWRKERGTYSA